MNEFIDFAGSEEAALVDGLPFYGYTRYGQVHYTLKVTPFSGVAKVAFLRLPGDLGAFRVAILVRDRAYAQILSDLEVIDWGQLIIKEKHHVDRVAGSELEGVNAQFTKTDEPIIDEVTVARAIASADRAAKLESQVNLFFVEAKRACRGVTEMISDQWVQIVIKNFSGLKENVQCNLEVSGNVKLRGFTTMAEVISFRVVNEDAVVKFKLGALSPLAQKALSEFLEVEALKLD